MVETNESVEALLQDARAMKALLGDLGVAPPLENDLQKLEATAQRRAAASQRNAIEKKRTLKEKIASFLSMNLGAKSAAGSAGYGHEHRHEQTQEHTHTETKDVSTDQSFESSARMNVPEMTGYEKSATLIWHIARHYELPTPKELMAMSVYTRQSEQDKGAVSELTSGEMRSMLKRGAQGKRHESLKATELVLLRAAYRATHEATRKVGSSRLMTTDLQEIFENGHTHDALREIQGLFQTEINQGKATDGVMAYHLAAYALAFRSAANELNKSLATYVNKKRQEELNPYRDEESQVDLETFEGRLEQSFQNMLLEHRMRKNEEPQAPQGSDSPSI